MPAAFENYAALLSTAAVTLNRRDLTAMLPIWVGLAEGEVNIDDRFRVLKSMVRSRANIESQFIPLPLDYISMQNFRVLEAPPPGRVDMVTTTQMDDLRRGSQCNGAPKAYCVVGSEMELLPIPDQQYSVEMIYYAQVPPLVAPTDTNWLLQFYPQVYLYGTLLHSAPYLKDDTRLATWAQLYSDAADKLDVSSDRGQFSGSTMKMRTRTRYR